MHHPLPQASSGALWLLPGGLGGGHQLSRPLVGPLGVSALSPRSPWWDGAPMTHRHAR